ncbi:hypothetical protein [Sporosarcina gallistercoris]|uniref:Uncharacterized protein n=1 Tax=Sporosarcina gallistercoris TaxID=2762245 RepID=A0ABR8PFP3_9BACL|nr:hypothetical protein [Sporosarcina gallistercoris]MBD7906995.1 hypothetical protein [Sporosarcina gallistercoris]
MKFSDDKKSVAINTTSKLTKGEYTVTVTGLSDKALTSSVTVADEKVAKINVLSETAPLNPTAKAIGGVSYQANETAFVNYEVLNQYGEKMTNQTINWTQSTGGKVDVATPGQLIIGNTASAGVKFIPGNKVFLTGVHANSATVVNAEVTIGLEAKAATTEIKGVYNTSTNKLEALPAGFAANKYVLLFEVKDQYGNKLAAPTLSELTYLSNNPLFVAQPTTANATTVTIDDVVYQAIELAPGSQAAKGGTTDLQLISNNTGKVSKYTITADALPAVSSFKLSTPEKLIAGSEKVEVPFAAVDQYGNAVTKHSALTGVTLSSGLTLEKQQDGSAKLFYTAPSNATTNDVITTLTSLVPTNGDYSNVQITVKPNAKGEAVIGLNSEVSTNVAAGNEVKFKGEDLLVQDQYGRTLTKKQVNDWLDASTVENSIVLQSDIANTTIQVTSSDVVADNAFVYANDSTDVFTVKATVAGTVNTEKLVFSLAPSTAAATPVASEIVSASSKSVTFTRVTQSEYASYEVADLGVMYNDGVATGSAAAGYDVTPKVYGVTAAGAKVLLPSSKYTITTNGKLDTATAGKIKDLATLGYVAGDFKDINGVAKDIPVKVTIMVEDGNGAAAATIEKDLVVSNKAVEVNTITFTDKVVNGGAFVDANGTKAIATSRLNAVIDELEDQYGVAKVEAATITISNVSKVDGSALTVVSNATTATNITGAEAGDKFTATFKYAGGKTASVNFVVSSTVTP